MARRLTLIAGSGALAPLMADAARRNGDALQIIDLVGRRDLEADRVEHIPLAEASRLMAAVLQFPTTHLVLAGAVHISDAEREGIVRAFGLAGQVARIAGDIGLAGMIQLAAKMNRVKLIGAHELAPDLLAEEGHIAGPPLDPAFAESARIALSAARAIGTIDLGQTVIVSGNRPVAAEDAAGTDALLKRAAELTAAGLVGDTGMPLILAKARKPKQPKFVDLPTIGVQTVVNAAAAGISIIVVEAHGTLLMDRPGILREAAARTVTVVGLRHG
jgi:DUF1009 family protein